jgi:dipeptidyl aminopeptidase/acylaminoacyl peptidase
MGNIGAYGSYGSALPFYKTEKLEKEYAYLKEYAKWAIDNKVTQKDKIVIMGGSYGGYAVLVGMTMTPDMYVAGIDIVAHLILKHY